MRLDIDLVVTTNLNRTMICPDLCPNVLLNIEELCGGVIQTDLCGRVSFGKTVTFRCVVLSFHCSANLCECGITMLLAERPAMLC